MAAWEDALRSLGDDGKQLATDFRNLFGQIKNDMSSFLQSEEDRIKKLLTQFNNGDIEADVLALLLRNEKLFIQQHLDLIQARVEEAAERAITQALKRGVITLIGLL